MGVADLIKIDELRVTRLEYRCKVCRKWHAVGVHGVKIEDDIFTTTLVLYEKSRLDCPKLVKRRERKYNSQKRRDEYLKYKLPSRRHDCSTT